MTLSSGPLDKKHIRSNQCLTSSTRHGESITSYSHTTNSPFIDHKFNPLLVSPFSPMPNFSEEKKTIFLDEKLLNVRKKLSPSQITFKRWAERTMALMPTIDAQDLPKVYSSEFDYASFPLGGKITPAENLVKK